MIRALDMDSDKRALIPDAVNYLMILKIVKKIEILVCYLETFFLIRICKRLIAFLLI